MLSLRKTNIEGTWLAQSAQQATPNLARSSPILGIEEGKKEEMKEGRVGRRETEGRKINIGVTQQTPRTSFPKVKKEVRKLGII